MPLIWMLGPLEIGDPAGPRAVPLRRKQRELFALLLMRAGTVVSSAEIVDSLWGACPPASARANLHSYVHGLRQFLGRAAPAGGERPVRARNGYRLDLRPDECDAMLFERLAGEGRRALAGRQPALAVDQLNRALGLWRGPVLDGLDRHDWLAPSAARLEEAQLAAIEDRVQALLVLGRYAGLSAELAAATMRYPLHERLWGQLMITLHRTGRRAEALHAYARLHDLLDRELGVQPGSAVRTLHRDIVADG